MKNRRPFELELQVQKVDLLYRQGRTAPLMLSITAVLFYVYGWGRVPAALWLLWVAGAVVGAGGRAALLLAWYKAKDRIKSPRELALWHYGLDAFLFLSGVLLGTMGWLATSYFTTMGQFVIGLTILGTAAASVTAYCQSFRSANVILLPSIALWAIPMWLAGGPDNHIVAAMMFVFWLYNVRFGLNWSHYVDASIRRNLELHHNEERLRLNRDASGAIDWEWDLPTDDFRCEGRIQNLFGPGLSYFRGQRRDYLLRVHPMDRAPLEDAMDRAVQTGSLDTEHRVLWPDGQTQYVAVRGQVQVDGAGQPVRLTGICWNVTAKKVQDQVRHERDVYEAADRAKLIFLANASHEIRTPLAAINGFSELVLARRELPNDIRDDVNVILRNGKYLVSIVSDLLDLSKSEADRVYIQKAPMSPLREINDALLVVQDAARRKGLELRKSVDTPVPEFINGDVTRFRQIIINLLTNAVKYTNVGGATLHVSHVMDGERSLLRIVVADTGIGISEETRQQLFQPFARGQGADVQKETGSGLGLALSRSLARKMGGDIRLLEPTGAGRISSLFEFTLETGPLDGIRFVLDAQAGAEPAEKSAAAATSDRLRGQRILVVEDKENLRELMRRFLADHGAEVQTCANGEDAVAEATTHPYDVILMDLQMPVMDGVAAVGALRGRGYVKPIVALTAHASANDRELCERAGFNFYLSKPVNTDHLLKVLTDPALRGPREPTRDSIER